MKPCHGFLLLPFLSPLFFRLLVEGSSVVLSGMSVVHDGKEKEERKRKREALESPFYIKESKMELK